MIGAVGGDYNLGLVHWVYSVVDATNTDAVYAFLTELLNEAQFPSNRITIVLDRHSSHRSGLVRSLQADRGVQLIYTPVNSCALNNVEHCWAVFKRKWQRFIASLPLHFDMALLDQLVSDIAGQVGPSLTPRILRSTDQIMQ